MNNLDELRLIHSEIVAKLRHLENIEILSEHNSNNFALSLMFNKKPMTRVLIEDLFPSSIGKEECICSICTESVLNKKIRKLSCNHIYHKKCLDRWLIRYKGINCPVCRKHVLI